MLDFRFCGNDGKKKARRYKRIDSGGFATNPFRRTNAKCDGIEEGFPMFVANANSTINGDDGGKKPGISNGITAFA